MYTLGSAVYPWSKGKHGSNIIVLIYVGSASPQAVRKLLSLAETNKTKPHQPRQLGPLGLNSNQPSPAVRRAPSATGKLFCSNDCRIITIVLSNFFKQVLE